MEITLVDTSSWVESLRKDGNPDIRDRVGRLLSEGSAALCDMVLVELWNGARGRAEKETLRALEKDLLLLETDRGVWEIAVELARKCRAKGRTVPAADLLIAACAQRHGVQLDTCDSDFDFISEN